MPAFIPPLKVKVISEKNNRPSFDIVGPSRKVSPPEKISVSFEFGAIKLDSKLPEL
jgi:hypothetical protein